jgi:uncharacterized protein with PhoU and TrkA domain
MTDIEAKALALVNEIRREYPLAADYTAGHMALCRAIEQHEAFKQEVSDVVYRSLMSIAKNCVADAAGDLSSFIIHKPKPDPLVEAWIEATGNTVGMEPLNAALEARGLEIREKGQ